MISIRVRRDCANGRNRCFLLSDLHQHELFTEPFDGQLFDGSSEDPVPMMDGNSHVCRNLLQPLSSADASLEPPIILSSGRRRVKSRLLGDDDDDGQSRDAPGQGCCVLSLI